MHHHVTHRTMHLHPGALRRDERRALHEVEQGVGVRGLRLVLWGQKAARQKSTPRKPSWIFSGIPRWVFSGIFQRIFTFVISGV